MPVYIGFVLAAEPKDYKYSDNIVFIKLNAAPSYFEKLVYLLDEYNFSAPYSGHDNFSEIVAMMAHMLLNCAISREDGKTTITWKTDEDFDDSWKDPMENIKAAIQSNNGASLFVVPSDVRTEDRVYLVYAKAYSEEKMAEMEL